MLGEKEKSFYMHVAMGCRELSGCDPQQGAVLVRARQILSYGYNRKIIKDEKWEISSVYDAIFGSRHEDLTGTTLFCTYFPSVDDLILIVSTGISSLHFMGNVDKTESVKFLNMISKGRIPLEIVQLEK